MTPATTPTTGQQARNAWRVLLLLLLANLLNIFDRTLPAIVAEPIRKEWGLSDTELGLVFGGFTLVYALCVVPLGRAADQRSRKKIMAWGLALWSIFTGATGLAWSYASFFAARLVVGAGEASFGPASTALIGDLFPARRRSLATGIFMLGLPLGLLLAFFSTGAIVQAFGSWRAPFYLAMVPGLLLALCFIFIKEPERGAAEAAHKAPAGDGRIERPIRKVLSIPTVWWLIVSGVFMNMASYAAGGFLVPMMQRYFELSLQSAAIATGVIVGLSGLLGLTLGGTLADRMHRRNERARLIYGAVCMLLAAVLTAVALGVGREGVLLFTALFATGWLLQYSYYTCAYPAMQDVVEPRLRATAYAIYTALLYVLGAAAGPVVTGWLSDHYAKAAMLAAGAAEMNEQFKAVGLHGAMVIVPIALALTGVALLLTTRSFPRDAAAMRAGLEAVPAGR